MKNMLNGRKNQNAIIDSGRKNKNPFTIDPGWEKSFLVPAEISIPPSSIKKDENSLT